MHLLVMTRGVLAGIAVALCSCATTVETSRTSPEGPLEARSGENAGDGTGEAAALDSFKHDNSEAAAEPEPSPSATIPSPRVCDMFAKPGVLKRAALVRLLDAGLPRWLQGVEGDRALANHRFQGWLVKSLYPGDPCYKDLDLRGGDVVQKVNGKSIEKPEQAFDVAESLRTAPMLTVDYLRDGKARHLAIEIER